MAPSKRKRTSTVANSGASAAPKVTIDPRTELRNMWEFAALWQYCSIFSEALGLPEILIEDLEEELLHPDRHNIVPQIQLALLKHVTNRKGLNVGLFDSIVNGLYESYRDSSETPYVEDLNNGFADFDVPTKVRVLHKLSVWSFINPEKIRGETSEHTYDQWRIDPCGYDAKGNTYYMLDDNRLYKLTAAPEAVVAAPKVPKTAKKRRITVEPRDPNEKVLGNEVGEWSVVCISYEEWKEFTESFRRSKHPDEKAFHGHLTENLLPILEKEEEARQKKILDHKKKLELEAAVANRKRSSRVDARLAKQKEEEELAQRRREEEERQRLAKLEKKKKEKLHQEREKRLLARDERIRKRQEAQASRPAAPPPPEPERKSTRARASGTASKRAGDRWDFDCVCGVHGANYDDGTLIIACDKCEVWQHLGCLGIPKDKAEDEFVCSRCIRLAKEAEERAEEEKRQAIIRQQEDEERKIREKKEAEERKMRLEREAQEQRIRLEREAAQQLAAKQHQERMLHTFPTQPPVVQTHQDQLRIVEYVAERERERQRQAVPLISQAPAPYLPQYSPEAQQLAAKQQEEARLQQYQAQEYLKQFQAEQERQRQKLSLTSVLTNPNEAQPPWPYIPQQAPPHQLPAPLMSSPAAAVKPGPLSPSRQVVVNGFLHSNPTHSDIMQNANQGSSPTQRFVAPPPDGPR